jgi:hypothetical protein
VFSKFTLFGSKSDKHGDRFRTVERNGTCRFRMILFLLKRAAASALTGRGEHADNP